jgi:hypothetical protein
MKQTAIASILLFATASPAAADEAPSGYSAHVQGNNVIICPQQRNDRACPQPDGMLRQAVGTGEVVRLPQNCTNRPTDRGSHKGACYIDECVPPGTYRYGYGRPLECAGSSTFYFAQVAVSRQLPKDCRRSGGAVATVKRAPWGTSPYVCVGGCGDELLHRPRVTWGLILLLIAGASFVVLFHLRRPA